MKILCVTNLFPNGNQPTRGIFNWNLFAALQQTALLRVISPIAWTDEFRARRRGSSSVVTDRWGEWQGVPVIHPRYYYTPGGLRSTHGSLMKTSIARVFRTAVADFRPDIVLAAWAYPDGWAAWRLAREAGLPVAVKVHGSDLLMLEGQGGKRRRTVEMLKDVDATLAVSRNLADCAVQLGALPERVHLVHEGTNTQLFFPGERESARRELGLKSDGFRMLFVGNLVPVKGVKLLVEACHRLAAGGHAFDVDIIGEGPDHAALAKQIAVLGLTSHVHLLGRKPQPQLPNWYRAANLVVLPSYSEGIPNVLVESAACGTPFVATCVGGVPEIAHLSPLELVPPGDPVALADAIRNLLVHPEVADGPSRSAEVSTVADGVRRTYSVLSNIISARRTDNLPQRYVPQPALADH